MAITKEELIGLLNEDLEWEFAACIQYVQHAAAISGAKYDSIQKELVIHSQQELAHAQKISYQIDFLGGTPTIDVKERKVSGDNVDMLRLDLAGEENAIRRYKKRIGQAEEMKEYGLRRILEDILIQEEEHKRDLDMALA